MLAEDFDLLVENAVSRCKKLLVKKSGYGSETDRLENFKRAGALQGESPVEALVGMVSKHYVSVSMMSENPTNYSMKEWHDKIDDIINYSLLLEASLVDMGVR